MRRLRQLPRLARLFVSQGVPRRSLLFGPLSLGDDLLCTAVLREARKRGQPFAMMTLRPELFAGNPDPARLIPIDDYYVAAVRRLGGQVVQPYYFSHDPALPDRDVIPPRHIIAEMCRQADLHGTIHLRPYLHLSERERKAGEILPRQIAIHSSGLGAALPFTNKEWGAARFVELVNLLKADFNLVQIGAAGDPALPAAADLRGRTSLREAAAILSRSMAFIGLEGFLMHLARAVECSAVVIFGGRTPPSIVGYSCNTNLTTAVPCAPCGFRMTCDHALECMTRITPGSVAEAVRALVANRPAQLAVDTAELP